MNSNVMKGGQNSENYKIQGVKFLSFIIRRVKSK